MTDQALTRLRDRVLDRPRCPAERAPRLLRRELGALAEAADDGADAGIEQGFGGGRSALEITWFDNRFRNQIGFATTNFTTFEGTFFNIGKTRARGVETILKTDLPRRWEISGGYTFLSSRVLESTSPLDPAFAKGQELFRRPRHSGYAELRWKPGSWTFGATGIAVGDHTVTLGGVPANCTVASPNPQAVTVTVGATAQASFMISCSATGP